LLISVVMPCFNVADSVARTIKSVCDQTFADFELLAIDDGSVDETVQIIQDYADKCMPTSAQVRIILQENSGPGAARNRGMREARGDLIAFLDADDLWHSRYLATVAATFERYPQLDALACNSWDLSTGGYYLNVEAGRDAVMLIEDFFDAVQTETMVVRTSGVTIRRSVVASVGYMREDLRRSQDKEYWARLAASRVRWGFLPEPLVVYNGQRGQSVTRNESRFANLPSPETWSRDIWPLLHPDMVDGFREWHLRRARGICRECLQAGRDHQARAAAREALIRATDWRNRLFFYAVRFGPGRVYRLVHPVISWSKRLIHKVRGTESVAQSELDFRDRT